MSRPRRFELFERVDLCAIGEEVPEAPVYPPGEFHSTYYWLPPTGALSVSAWNSACRFGALESRKLGPRGGQWYAVVSEEKWREWRSAYVARSNALRAADARRRLEHA